MPWEPAGYRERELHGLASSWKDIPDVQKWESQKQYHVVEKNHIRRSAWEPGIGGDEPET